MSDDEDDPVVQEVDVFLSKQLSDHLYLFQYPVRPVNMKYDDIPHLCARVKPVQQKVEMELVLDTRSPNYERSKGEQIAINVDGTGDQAAANYYTGDRMDKQVLTSVKSGLSDGRFVVGCLKDGELHVTPLKGILQLRPSFVYLDRGDSKQESTGAGGEDSQDEEEEAKPITVRFARKDEDKERSTSYKHVTKKLEDEPWVHVVHHQTVDPASERERLLLVAQHGNDVSEFHVAPKQYLEKLVTKVEEEETQKPPLPSNVLSMTELRTMTLGDQIRALMMNAKVMRFTQLMALLTKGTDPTSALRCLQQVALMVQGCWVVKSDVLYPRDSLSPHSGAPAETLCRARDYVMWRFTQNRIVIRKDISTVVKVPAEEVKEILEQMARLKINKGWEFVFEYDQEFVNRHPEVVQRQLMLWDAKFQQLSKTLKISKADMDRKAKSDELAAACSSPEKPKRRRTISRSRTKSTSAGSGMSDLSDNEVESSAKERSRRPSGQSRSRRNSGRGELPTKADVPPPGAAPMSTTTTTTPETTPTPIFNGAQNVILNNSDITTPPPPSPSQHQQPPPCASTVPSVPLQSASAKEPGAASAQGQGDDLRREVNTFIRDKLTSRFVLSQSDVKTLFNMQLASLPPGHILGSGVSEKMLEQALFEEGGVLLTSHTEPVYVLGKVDDGHGEIRDILLDLLKVKTTVKTTLFKQRMEEAFGELPPDATWRKVLREYCVSKSGQWALKCTVDNKL